MIKKIITRAKVQCFHLEIMEQCLSYIENMTKRGGHTCPRESALLELAKEWPRQKICQLPIHDSTLAIILTNSIFFLRDVLHLI